MRIVVAVTGTFPLLVDASCTTSLAGLCPTISYVDCDSNVLSQAVNDILHFATSPADFKLAILHFVGIVVVATPLFALDAYVENRLALTWRIYLTKKMMERYFSNR